MLQKRKKHFRVKHILNESYFEIHSLSKVTCVTHNECRRMYGPEVLVLEIKNFNLINHGCLLRRKIKAKCFGFLILLFLNILGEKYYFYQRKRTLRKANAYFVVDS
jgi:hypothetical protein